jgi:hypothetical protein
LEKKKAAYSPNLWVACYDMHFPQVHKPTLDAMLDFIEKNQSKIAGFVFGGDQLDNAEISHHNASKPLFRPTGSYMKNHRDFQTRVLDPLHAALPKTAQRIWIDGNHEHWSEQLVETSPELRGLVENHLLLNIEKQGWKYLGCGQRFKLGKLNIIHGETLTGLGNQAPGFPTRKAVETYCGSVLFGHCHTPQTFTKVLPHHQTDKWQATCAPILGTVNPGYIRNRPHNWLNGFVIVETLAGGNFNLYSVVVSNGKFSFAGVVYGGGK